MADEMLNKYGYWDGFGNFVTLTLSQALEHVRTSDQELFEMVPVSLCDLEAVYEDAPR